MHVVMGSYNGIHEVSVRMYIRETIIMWESTDVVNRFLSSSTVFLQFFKDLPWFSSI